MKTRNVIPELLLADLSGRNVVPELSFPHYQDSSNGPPLLTGTPTT